MEAIVRPLIWAEWPEGSRRAFQGFRSTAGEEMILDKNMFVERVLPASICERWSRRKWMSIAVLSHRRRRIAGRRSPGPREIPIDGAPCIGRRSDSRLRRLVDRERHPEAVRQRRSRRHSGRAAARVLPRMAQPKPRSRSAEAISSKKIPVRKSAAQSQSGFLGELFDVSLPCSVKLTSSFRSRGPAKAGDDAVQGPELLLVHCAR